MKMIKRYTWALGLALFCGAAWAQNLSIATGGTGGVYYPYGGGLASVLSKNMPGVAATAEVTGGSVDNLKLVGSGKPYIAFTMSDAAQDAYKGEDKFKSGKVPLRTLAVLYPNRMHVVSVDGRALRPRRWTLRRTHHAIDVAEDRGRGPEELAVASELLEASRLVLASDTEQLVHLLAEREPVGAVRLDQSLRVDVVLGRLDRWLPFEVCTEPGHRLPVHDIDPPRLHVAAARGAGRVLEQLAQHRVVDRVGQELAYRQSPVGRIANTHGTGGGRHRSVR